MMLRTVPAHFSPLLPNGAVLRYDSPTGEINSAHAEALCYWGLYFGFPSCCVSQFVATFNGAHPSRDRAGAPWFGTGFIPCVECAPAAEADFPKFVCERITPNRLCLDAFPHGEAIRK